MINGIAEKSLGKCPHDDAQIRVESRSKLLYAYNHIIIKLDLAQ